MGNVESRDGSNCIDRISELPTEILHIILYFLSQEDAVRTSVLSKSWRYIWCTRPNLDFSDRYYFKRDRQEFLSIVDKNLQRYYDQRLCVEEFHLRISLGEDLDQESVSLLEKWIPLLTNMGMKKFCLSLPSEVGYEPSPRYLRLPPEVFVAQSLQDLHLERFMLDRKAVERIVLFKHLKSLCLKKVCIEDEVFEKVISSCPLIETLDVKECQRLRTIKANGLHNLNYFSFTMYDVTELGRIEIHPPSPETINITFGNLRFHKGADFRNLDQLYLSRTKLSWDDLSSCKFPSLERLHISSCDGLEETQLFIDAPNIVYFKYEGDVVPSISFATTSEEWKSDLQFYWHPNDAPSSWFLRLKELLKSLSKSKIYLTISRISFRHGNIQENINLVQDIISGGGNNPAVAVEQLSLRCCYPSPYHLSHMSSLLNCVFSICRPRNLKGHLGGMSGKEDSERVECLWKILMERESDDQLFKHAFWLQDLEAVSFEIKDRGEWRPTSLLDLPNYQEMEFTCVRFAFKWRRLHLVRDPSKKPRKRKILRI